MLHIKLFDEIGKRFHLEAYFEIKIVNLFRLWGDTDRLKELDQDFDLFDLNGDSAIDPQELREYTFSMSSIHFDTIFAKSLSRNIKFLPLHQICRYPKGQQNHPEYRQFFENVPSERYFSEVLIFLVVFL